MGGGGTRSEQLVMTPEERQRLTSQTDLVQQQINALQPQVNQAAGALQTGFAGAPQLGAAQVKEFTPQFSNTLDALSRAQLAQGTQGINAQLGTQQRALAQQFRGQPGVGQVLGRQAAMQSRLQANPLLTQIASTQAQRQLGQQQLGLSALEAANQARLAQQSQANQAALGGAEFGRQSQQLQNQTIAQQLALRTLPVQQQQQLLGNLASLAGVTGTRQSKEGK